MTQALQIRFLFLAAGFFILASPAAWAAETSVQAHDHGTKPKPADYHSPPSAPPKDKAVRKTAIDTTGKPQKNFHTLFTNDNEWFAQLRADRLEYRTNGDEQLYLWDGDFWIGGDYNKLYIESEGERTTDGTTESADIEVFWNHTISSFWDSQIGIRHDFEPGESRSFFAAGLQGMSPYQFEIDATSYISEDGDISATLEAERDFYITSKVAVQPRLETTIGVDDVPEYTLGQGFRTVELGMRARYEFSRKFAPYVGVEWEKSVGETADMMRAENEDPDKVFFVSGLRFWF